MYERDRCGFCLAGIEWHWSTMGTRVPLEVELDADRGTYRVDAELGQAYYVGADYGNRVDHRDACPARANHPAGRAR